MRSINLSSNILVSSTCFQSERVCPRWPQSCHLAELIHSKVNFVDVAVHCQVTTVSAAQTGVGMSRLFIHCPSKKLHFCSLSRLMGFPPSSELIRSSHSPLLINHNLQLVQQSQWIGNEATCCSKMKGKTGKLFLFRNPRRHSMEKEPKSLCPWVCVALCHGSGKSTLLGIWGKYFLL